MMGHGAARRTLSRTSACTRVHKLYVHIHASGEHACMCMPCLFVLVRGSAGLWSYGVCSYGLYSYGAYSYDLYRYDLVSLFLCGAQLESAGSSSGWQILDRLPCVRASCARACGMPLHMSMHMSLHMSTYMSTYMSTHMPMHVSMHVRCQISSHACMCVHVHFYFISFLLLLSSDRRYRLR